MLFRSNNSNVTVTTAGKMETADNVFLGSLGYAYWSNGWIASVAFYNRRLPDAILKYKTTVGVTY